MICPIRLPFLNQHCFIYICDTQSTGSLYLDTNLLTGDVAESLYTLTNLATLRLTNNTGLSGSISTSIGLLPGMQYLLIKNTGMGGPLPNELYNLTELRTLDLSQGSFTGPLLESVSQLVNLDLVNLSNNTLTGTIPTGFDSLPYLGKLVTDGFCEVRSC